MRNFYAIAAVAGMGLMIATAHAACPDGFSGCNGNVCGPGTDCNPQLGECRPCCPAGSYRGVQPCCDCPGVGQGQACMNGTCDGGCNVADVSVACGATLSILPGALLGGNVQASGGTIDMQGILAGSLTAGAGGTVTMRGTCDPHLAGGGSLSARDFGTATMSDGCVGGVFSFQDGALNVTGGQILQSIRTLGTGHAEIGAVTVGRLPDGSESPFYMVKAEAQSVLELNGAELLQGVDLTDLATVKLNDASIHGSVGMVAGNPGVFPQQPTVIMSGGTVGGSIGAYTVSISGGNIGGGVDVNGLGATGTIGAATVAGQVTAADRAVIAISGGTMGGIGANGATLSSSGAAITGAASVNSFGSNVATLTVNGGTVGNVMANGSSGTGPLNGLALLSGADVQQTVTASDGGWLKLISGNVANDAISSGTTGRTPNTDNPDGAAGLLEIEGGIVTGSAMAQNRGGLKLVDGSVTGDLIAANSSRVNLSGGTVQGNLIVSDSARATQSGGAVAGDATISGQRLTMTGGSIAGNADFSGFGFLIMENGSIGGNVNLLRGAVVNGGTIGGQLILKGTGQLEMSGGTVQGFLQTLDSTQAIVTGGTFKGGEAAGTSTIDASGGTFNPPDGGSLVALAALQGSTVKLRQNVTIKAKLVAWNDSRIEMSGGTAMQGAEVIDHATFVLSGSNALITGDLTANGSGIATIAGGSVFGSLTGNASSTVFMTGGHVTGRAQALQTGPNASFTFEGGQIDDFLLAFESSKVTMNGGTVLGSAEAQESSKLTINGGSIGGDVLALNNATIEMSGMPSVEGFLKARDDSTINASGGTVRRATASENARLNLNGIVFSAGDLTGNANSQLTMSGGTVGADLILSDGATMEMSGGLVQGKCLTQGAGYLAISGGSVTGAVESQNTDQEFGGIHLSGGVVNGDFITGGAAGFADSLEGSAVVNGNLIIRGKFNMQGGTVHQNAATFNNGQLLISGGAVALNVEAQNHSTVYLVGGSVGDDLRGFHSGKINMSGGIVQGNFLGFGNSVITKTGGCVFGEIKGVDACTMNISGGPCSGGSGLRSIAGAQASSFNVVALGGATLKFIGTDLSATLVDPDFQGMFSLYELTGTLADGSTVSGQQFRVQNGTGALYKLLLYVPADLDFDGDVDLDDLEVFKACSTGPSLGPPTPECQTADFDHDNDVDADDFGVYQRCFRGVDAPADPACVL